MRSLMRSVALAAAMTAGGLVGLAGCSITGDVTPQADREDVRVLRADEVRPASQSLPPARVPEADVRRGPIVAETNRPPENPGAGYSLAYPTGARASSVLLLEADGPKEVRIGQLYKYTLRVTNLTSAPLHGVSVYALSSELTGARSSSAPVVRTDPADDRSGHDGTPPAADKQSVAWNVGTLAPKESKSHQVEGMAEEVGVLTRCLGVTYTPTLCTSVTIVKPELQITKEAPAEILLCQELNYRYTVTNIGTGTATAVHVNEALPDGLLTQGGEKTISFDLGDLPQGQSKGAVIKLKAAHVGQFSSRASASSGDARSESREVATVVREPVLAVAVEGPEARYANEPVDFRVTVRNTGDAPAQHAMLHLSSPDSSDKFADRDLGVLEPSGSKTVTVSTRAGSQAGQLRMIANADAVCARPATERASVAVRTIAALLLECNDSLDPVRVGNTTIYTISVTNQGSGTDSNVRIKAILPPEESYVASIGASEATADGQTLSFAPIASLASKQVVQWKVEVKGSKAGDARFNVELTSDSLTRPATKSESTRVVDDAVAPAGR